jgi:hypothetical protein
VHIRGINYDAGRVFNGMPMRPDFDLQTVHRELQIIKEDLHCNTVKIQGCDIGRLTATARDALEQGLKVWLSPELFDKPLEDTLVYLGNAAMAAEELYQQDPNIVLSVGTELSAFMQGILPGNSIAERLSAQNWGLLRSGEHNRQLNDCLNKMVSTVREIYHGQVTYAALAELEQVDWGRFDIVGIDLYRDKRNRDIYTSLIERYKTYGKPVVITEFGCCTFRGAEDMGGTGSSIIDWGQKWPPKQSPRLKGDFVYDQTLQARELADQLRVIGATGIEGAFIFEFVQYGPRIDSGMRKLIKSLPFDPDIANYTLVKLLFEGYGNTYPDMTWEPKEAFRAVAEYYGQEN